MNSREAFDVSQLALLGEAIECLGDAAVFVWDEDRNYVAVNQAACRLVGKTRRELLEMKVGDLSPDRASPLFEEVQHAGVHTGTLTAPSGEIEFMTCQTRVAGLPYMVSVCWPRSSE
jgi:PAS domain S-box-containing protein